MLFFLETLFHKSTDFTAEARPKTDYVLIVDVSGSMMSAIPKVQSMLRSTISVLQPTDRVGIVLFNHEARVLFDLRPVTPETKDFLLSLIETQVRSSGGTSIPHGIFSAIEMAHSAHCVHNQTQKKTEMEIDSGEGQKITSAAGDLRDVTFLFLSDGMTQSREEVMPLLSSSLSALNSSFSFQQREENSLKKVDDGNDCDYSQHREITRRSPAICGQCCPSIGSLIVHSFGFGVGHDVRLLQELVSPVGCTRPGAYYFLQTEEDVVASIGGCLALTESFACQPKLSAWINESQDDPLTSPSLKGLISFFSETRLFILFK